MEDVVLMRNSPDFMEQARTLASGTREPYIAWSYLKRWATGKGPSAMKAAMVGFLETHGSKPESASIIPEIVRSASLMPPEDRRAMLELANGSFSAISGFSHQAPGAAKMPLSGDRPASGTFFRPKPSPSAPLRGSGERFIASGDIGRMGDMRDMILNKSEELRAASSI